MKHLFNHKWYLKGGYPSENITKNNLNVFGAFICGGGSTMGYKLAGYNHLGGVEIDKQVAEIYKLNHNPKYLYNEDIREFNKREDLPKELYELDILDGSPPCSTFSIAGSREKAWNKEKIFREGQTKQTLDDLLFVYLDTIFKLKPKVAILENVKGLISGNAKIYVKKIIEKLNKNNYNSQIILLNAASMGVPQKRERVFIIASQKELNYPKLKLEFNEIPILYKEIRNVNEIENKFTDYDYSIWKNRIKSDRNFSDTLKRTENRNTNWNSVFVHDNKVSNTITSTHGGKLISYEQPKHMSNNELMQIGTYPLDYNFLDVKPKYLIGMSVPPVMTAQIANQIYLQWFKNN